MSIEEKIKMLPKVDLHCHIDGSIRPKTILELALKENIHIPNTELEEFKKLVQVSPDCTSLIEYLQKFDLPLKIMQKAENIERIVVELLEDCMKQNIKYIELRFSPFLFMRGGLSFEEVIEAILRGREIGKKKYDVSSNLILACMRHHSPEESIQVVERSRKYLEKGVVAIDLAGNEADFPPELHKEAFKLAKQYGFHLTVHAGEVDAPHNIKTSIEMLYAERIGHGVYAIKEKEICKLLRETQIPLEVCITSNVQTQAVREPKSHPVKQYFDEGIKITLNTDNTTVSNTSILKEYMIAIEQLNFTLEDVKKMILNGLDVSFATEEEKMDLKRKYIEEFSKINQ